MESKGKQYCKKIQFEGEDNQNVTLLGIITEENEDEISFLTGSGKMYRIFKRKITLIKETNREFIQQQK